MNTRIGSGALLSILLLGGCAILESNASVGATSLTVETQVMALDPDHPQRTRFGDLTLLSSFVLRSAAVQFGGFSGLAVDPSGRLLYAVSDRGYGFSARLRHNTQARLIGLHDWEMMPLQTPQEMIAQRRKGDAEALVREPDGAWLVAFEHVHRVWRYPPSAVAFAVVPEAVAMPAELEQAPGNGGLEAMTRLADGRLLVLTELFENAQGDYRGWIVTPSGFDAITYVPQDGFRPTDLATLPGGDVLLLERRYRPVLGVAIRIRRIAGASIRPQARLHGRELLHLRLPWQWIILRDLPSAPCLTLRPCCISSPTIISASCNAPCCYNSGSEKLLRASLCNRVLSSFRLLRENLMGGRSELT